MPQVAIKPYKSAGESQDIVPRAAVDQASAIFHTDSIVLIAAIDRTIRFAIHGRPRSEVNRDWWVVAVEKTPGNAYILLDGVRFPDLLRHLYSVEDLPEYFLLFKGTYFESISVASPCLARVKKVHDGLLPLPVLLKSVHVFPLCTTQCRDVPFS